jgi:UDP-N-acetylglucosamine 1-carboxyvinyltransferase
VKELHGAEHEVIPDRIEAGTFLAAGAISGEEVTLRRVEPEHLRAVTDPLSAAGYAITSTRDTISLSPGGTRRALKLDTLPYPGFPTDMQAQMCALLAMTDGISVVTENVFPQRFMHVAELKRMGAEIELQGSTAVINGVERLSAAPVMASDLRASAALVLAGLQADGVTEVHRVYHIDRGYESIDEKLNSLGAVIERVKV